jgi:internalin A
MQPGPVVTFYSYKGGTGRSMALANVAWVLALAGKRVLTVDWDLEAPGLHRYFLPFLKDSELADTPGLIDLFWSYTDVVLAPRESWPPGVEDPLLLADAQRFAVPLDFRFPDPAACLHFLGAGRQDASYAGRVRNFDWNAFYGQLGGAQFVQSLRERALGQYDFVIVDSRTGVSDTSGICTMQMPDSVVLCYTYNRQSIRGVEAVAKAIRAERGEAVKLFPVAMRVHPGVDGYQEAQEVARELLSPVLSAQFPPDALAAYLKNCEVNHYPEYSFEETLAVFREEPGKNSGLLHQMVWLAEIAGGVPVGSLSVPDLGAAVRKKFLRRFAFRDPRLSQLAEALELPPAEAYSRLSGLASTSADDPDDPAWVLKLAQAFDAVADRMRGQGLTEQSATAAREGITLLKNVSGKDRNARAALAAGLVKLAVQLDELARYDEAVSTMAEAIYFYGELAEEQPELRPNLANAFARQGVMFAAMRQQVAGSLSLSKAVDIYVQLANEQPEAYEPDLARCYTNVGKLLFEMGEYNRAYELFYHANDLYYHLSEKKPDLFEPDLAVTLKHIIRTLLALRSFVSLESWAVLLVEVCERLAQPPAEASELDISALGLDEIPASLGRLSHLRRLDVSGNKLTKMPDELGNLTQLRSLNLSGNNLVSLPESLENLSALEGLYLHGNVGLGLPAEVLGPTEAAVRLQGAAPARPADILGYYFRLRSGERPPNEAKLILVGNAGVGKTTLATRLVTGQWKSDAPSTQGLEISDLPLKLRDGEEVRLHVWDFGGQEIFQATHQIFFSRRSLYLLVLNGRDGAEAAEADYWLRLIESLAGGSPVIVVLNKILEREATLNYSAVTREHPSVRGFAMTDCVNGAGIDGLREAISREVGNLEGVRSLLPGSWFAIKEYLAARKKDYISAEEYRDICLRHGEADEVAQEHLADYLHNLGVLLYFADDPRLQGTVVLNPRWVTRGVSHIIGSKQVADGGGELRLSDLPAILPANEYPRRTHRFLLDLMRKFELCFSFPDDETHYLIPALLSAVEPPEAAGFDPAGCMTFLYRYRVLPPGLLPRFIVRTHVMSEGQPRWRTGVILKFEDNRALVSADQAAGVIGVMVDGPAAGRRRLLTVIRSDFERIQRDLAALSPEEMLAVPGEPELLVPYLQLLYQERQGLPELQVVWRGEPIVLDVQQLLNQTRVEPTPAAEKSPRPAGDPVRVFCSYAHKDKHLRDEFTTHLKLLQRSGLIDWHDHDLAVGFDTAMTLAEQMNSADLILLLISPDYLASDYIYDVEMARALERHARGETRVIPVLLRPTDWLSSPLAKLAALPSNGRPVTLWTNADEAWVDIARGIRRIVNEMQA